MFFGAKARFGIECQFKTFTEPRRPIWGEIWIWAGGQRLGDEPSHADVGLVALMLCASLAERTGPEDETLAGSNKDDIWNTIYDGLYGSTDDKTADKSSGRDRLREMPLLRARALRTAKIRCHKQ